MRASLVIGILLALSFKVVAEQNAHALVEPPQLISLGESSAVLIIHNRVSIIDLSTCRAQYVGEGYEGAFDPEHKLLLVVQQDGGKSILFLFDCADGRPRLIARQSLNGLVLEVTRTYEANNLFCVVVSDQRTKSQAYFVKWASRRGSTELKTFAVPVLGDLAQVVTKIIFSENPSGSFAAHVLLSRSGKKSLAHLIRRKSDEAVLVLDGKEVVCCWEESMRYPRESSFQIIGSLVSFKNRRIFASASIGMAIDDYCILNPSSREIRPTGFIEKGGHMLALSGEWDKAVIYTEDVDSGGHLTEHVLFDTKSGKTIRVNRVFDANTNFGGLFWMDTAVVTDGVNLWFLDDASGKVQKKAIDWDAAGKGGTQ